MRPGIYVETFCGFGGFAEGKRRAGRKGRLVSINHDRLPWLSTPEGLAWRASNRLGGAS